MGDITQFVPGLVVALAIGVATGSWAASGLGMGRAAGVTTMISLGAILTTTLSIGSPEAGTVPGTCSFTRWWPAPIEELSTINEISLNVLLFVPLGVMLGASPRSRSKTTAIAATATMPFVIETIQLLVPSLNRYCDTADITDNLTGLVIGLLVGTIAGRAAVVVKRHHERAEASRVASFPIDGP